ncbi:MAG: SH3 domain-containing protein [Lachnospiraceae bacterium]|nr:SH3 domain-containing protein [Lachnospiraceae bacterium]
MSSEGGWHCGLRVLFLLTGIFCAIVFWKQDCFAATAVKGSVKCKSGIVRETASASSECAFCVKEGEDVLILSEEKGKDDQKWYKIRVQDKTGYIRSDLVTKSKETVTIDTPEADAKNAQEKEAGAEAGNKAEAGDQAEAENPEPTEESKNTEGSQGKSSQLGKVKGSGINVRKAPVDGDVVTTVSAGVNVTVKSAERGSDGNLWYAISFVQNKNALTGYIRSDYVEGVTLTEDAPEGQQDGAQEAAETAPSDETKNKQGFIRGTSVRVRDKEGNGAVVVQLNAGHELTILDEVKADDNYTWYKVAFEYQGSPKEGYVRSDLVNRSAGVTENAPKADEAFEKVIAEFPESYKNSLRILHSKYPNWKIVPVNTGLKWEDAVNAECAIGKNLTSMSSIPSWKSTDPRAYNSEQDRWYGFDGGSWASASPAIIKYYLDPRNFLDETGVFQFETLEFKDYQNESGTGNILSGSFMSGSYADADGVTRSFATTFVEAGRENGISPYHLASRCLQEQGLTGSSECVKGNVAGYENLFNFFNIGAYAANGQTAPVNGLIYASGTDENYCRPWNTRYRSIMGAAKYVGEKYVKKGQNTLYFQKFNVINAENGIYSHQYMSNICAAGMEAERMRRAYTDMNQTLEFRIPYYADMPESPCQKPMSESSPNCELSSLGVEGHSLIPEFTGGNEYYSLSVDDSVSSITINATPQNQYASVGGTGTFPVYDGTNVFLVVCKAQNGTTKTYKLTVIRK